MLLVVDDDRDLRESLTDFLALQGHIVHCVANGRAAIEWLKGRENYPGLIFLDLVMPVLDGWGFLLERSQNPLISVIPVVVMSGSPFYWLIGLSARCRVLAFQTLSFLSPSIRIGHTPICRRIGRRWRSKSKIARMYFANGVL
jgi:DNA-binding NtrC family response regulator